jgi:hypothetical protein
VAKKIEKQSSPHEALESVPPAGTKSRGAKPWPIAPEPVPEAVVARAKASFARRSNKNGAGGSDTSSADKRSRRPSAPPTAGIAS